MKTLITLCITLFCSLFLYAQKPDSTSVDYLNSGYYIKMAEAKYAYLKDEHKKAYEILLNIDSIIPLLNTPEYNEVHVFIELCLLYENYEKAYRYIYDLIANHGYKESFFYTYKNIKKLRKQKFYNSIALAHLQEDFQADTVLVNKVQIMLRDDQFFRTMPYYKDTSLKNTKTQCDPNWRHPYAKQFDSIDNINYLRLITIINDKGFPLSQNIKYTLYQRSLVYGQLMPMLMHFIDTFKFEPMKQILLENIKIGNCPPALLANMIDSRCRMEQCFIYGIYNGISREQICDFEKLDERRAAIGMPPHKLECEIKRLISLKYISMSKVERKALEEQVCDF